MPTYQMRAPNGRVYQIQGPPNATDAEVAAAILRQHPEAGRKPKQEPMGRGEAFVRGVERGMKPVGDIVRRLDPVSNIVNYFFPGVEKNQQAREQRLATEGKRAAAERPNVFTAGQITGEIAATAPIIAAGGGGLAVGGRALARTGGKMVASGTRGGRAVQKLGRATQATGRAVQTGGVGVRAPTRTAVAAQAPVAATRKGRMGLRLGGGAAAGAAAAELTDQEVVDAALVGSFIPVLGTIARRGAGATYDLLRGRIGDTRAAEVMRNLISSNPSAIAAALREAPENARANTAEFLASQGLLTPELAAATRIASASSQGAPLEQVARARAAGQEEMRAALRGGETGTEAMQNIGAMRQQVREITDPMREEALRRADIGRTQIIPAEQAAERARAAAASEVDRARRFLMAGERRGALAETLGELPPSEVPMPTLQRVRGEAGALEQRGAQAAQRSLEAGAAARSAQEVADNLRAQGLQPLDIGTVVGDLRRKAADAEFVNPPRFRVLTEFANNLERRAASQGGVIDATGLYELRKGMADTVADLLGPMDPGALQRRTAELVGEATPLIDEAIERAGGTGWGQYLRTFTAGMRDVERQEFARALEKLPEKRFRDVMAGKDPDFVSKFFGPGRFDINVELFGSQLPVAQRLAREIGEQVDVATTGMEGMPTSLRLSHGAGARARVMEDLQPGMRNRFARLFVRPDLVPGVSGGVAADQIARGVSQMVSENAMRSLVPALASPQAASNLLGVRSTSNVMADFVNRLGPRLRAALGQALQQSARGAAQPVPAAPALPEIDVPGADRPFSNIDYDEYGNYIGPRR